jgi:hypothetical protein
MKVGRTCCNRNNKTEGIKNVSQPDRNNSQHLKTDLIYILEFAETAAKNLRVELPDEPVGLDLDDEALDGIAEITREERSKLG